MASPAHVPMQDAAPPLDVADRIESSNGAPLSADVAPPVDAADDRDFRLDQPLSAGGKPNFREKQIKVLRSSPPSLFWTCKLQAREMPGYTTSERLVLLPTKYNA